MKKTSWTSLLLIIPSLIFGSELFGTGLHPVAWKPSCTPILDFNGDAIADSLIIFRTDRNFSLNKSCRQVGLHDATLTAQPQLILGILLSNKSKSGFTAYAVHEDALFTTPIWDAPSLPIATHCTEKTIATTNLNTVAKGAVIALGTEAGIDIFLYYNGTKFILNEPSEEP